MKRIVFLWFIAVVLFSGCATFLSDTESPDRVVKYDGTEVKVKVGG